MIDLGDSYTNGFEVRAEPVYPATEGVLTTPASKTCTITLPDDSTVSGTLTTVATGVLRLDYATTQAGRHTGRLVTVNPDSAHTFEFDVDAGASGIVSLADARAHLGQSATTDDEELRRFIDAATDFIEGRIGAVARRTIVETVTPASDGTLFLDGPVISLTSMTDTYGYGWTYDVAYYVADASGAVRPLAYTSSGNGYPVTVTYVGGRAIVPALIRQAALDYIKWMWESQRGASALPIAGGEFEVGAPATVPFKILQALEPYMSPVVA